MDTNNLRYYFKEPEKPWSPETIEGYSDWHEIIDYICWLFKIMYSSRGEIRKKSYRLDQLFINYLSVNKINLMNTRRMFPSLQISNCKPFANDLKRGWYNELSYSLPLKKSTLGLSNKDIELNKEISSKRFQFPSWKIISAYYSIYFYLRSVDLLKIKGMSITSHYSTIKTFNNNVLGSLTDNLWKFPLDLIYKPGTNLNIDILSSARYKYTRFKYCNHPREPHLSIKKISERIHSIYQSKAIENGNNIYTVFNLLHDFRVWVNYIDIDNLLNLYGSGYKAFMDQNLTILNYFIGGISEICFIATVGEDSYLEQLQEFYDSFVVKDQSLDNDFQNTPIYQRCMIYSRLELTKAAIKLRKKNNPNDLVFVSSIT